jgi:hypothetical protein
MGFRIPTAEQSLTGFSAAGVRVFALCSLPPCLREEDCARAIGVGVFAQ